MKRAPGGSERIRTYTWRHKPDDFTIVVRVLRKQEPGKCGQPAWDSITLYARKFPYTSGLLFTDVQRAKIEKFMEANNADWAQATVTRHGNVTNTLTLHKEYL